jgi:hypothetical protein
MNKRLALWKEMNERICSVVMGHMRQRKSLVDEYAKLLAEIHDRRPESAETPQPLDSCAGALSRAVLAENTHYGQKARYLGCYWL